MCTVHQLSMLFICVVIVTSGAVDEDIFDRSFDKVPAVNVSYHGFVS